MMTSVLFIRTAERERERETLRGIGLRRYKRTLLKSYWVCWCSWQGTDLAKTTIFRYKQENC